MEQMQPGTAAKPSLEAPIIVTEVIAHLCEGECHAFGDLVEWCESRGDCTVAVVCPSCARQWIIDDDELDALRRWTATNGTHLGCGVSFKA
ncbi:MAG TPA: hypothetical protein VFP05_01300 [Thermomicrobiales bacterium]|nr:hypothetical protein [Thermomicrobiales bacterium]